jgi:hypothetical protein
MLKGGLNVILLEFHEWLAKRNHHRRFTVEWLCGVSTKLDTSRGTEFRQVVLAAAGEGAILAVQRGPRR